jgi:hypothetical protein
MGDQMEPLKRIVLTPGTIKRLAAGKTPADGA